MVPNQHSVYEEYLPDYIVPAKENVFDQIIKSGPGFNLLHLKDTLIASKVFWGDYLYNKTDSHWSEIGAYVGYRKIIDQLKTSLPKIIPILLEKEDFIIDYNPGGQNKKLLNITDTDYNAWTGEITEINPEPDNRENINNYLIIKIEESKSQANTSPEYKFAACFLQLNTSQSQGNNYIPLPVDSSVSKDVYTQKDITNILTKIIEDCHERGGANLNIEFFTDGKLLYTNFESWEYNCFDSLTQLKRTYFVNVRSLTRLGTMYSKMPVYQHWKSRWERLTTNSIDTQTVNNS
jgi:hypothetical protein